MPQSRMAAGAEVGLVSLAAGEWSLALQGEVEGIVQKAGQQFFFDGTTEGLAIPHKAAVQDEEIASSLHHHTVRGQRVLCPPVPKLHLRVMKNNVLAGLEAEIGSIFGHILIPSAAATAVFHNALLNFPVDASQISQKSLELN